jgi:predicted DNA-binding protein
LWIGVEEAHLSTVQVSTRISKATKARLERCVRKTGQTRARLLEDALLQHLQALEELPADVIVPARIVLSKPSAERYETWSGTRLSPRRSCSACSMTVEIQSLRRSDER